MEHAFSKEQNKQNILSAFMIMSAFMVFSLTVLAEPLEEYKDDRSDEDIKLSKQKTTPVKKLKRHKKYIYQWRDANGNTMMSDKPHPGAIAIELPSAQTFSAPKTRVNLVTNNELNVQEQPVIEDSSPPDLSIISPANGSWLNNNIGNLTVKVSLNPYLKLGQKLEILIDGVIKNTANSTTVTLKNLSRGEHSVVAQIKMKSSRKILLQKQNTFFVRRPFIRHR